MRSNSMSTDISYDVRLEDATITCFESIAAAQSPENYRILSPKGKASLSIGAIAYLLRTKAEGQYTVIESSFNPERRQVISKLVIGFLQNIAQNRHSEITIRNQIKEGMLFIDWADQNNYPDVFSNVQSARKAYHEYILELRDELLYAGMKSQTALLRQSGALAMLNQWFERKTAKISAGITPIRFQNDTDHTKVPEDEDVESALDLADKLFHNIGSFLLDAQPFPYLLQLPNEQAWTLPCSCWILPKWKLARREQMKNGNWIWDYENGVLNSLEYIAKRFNYTPSGARSNRKRSEQSLANANTDPRHPSRLKMAYWAVSSFQLKMFAVTGINPSDLVKQIWEPEMENNPITTRQHFRSFKTRAGHFVDFEIHVKFLREFQKYCKLRNFLAADRNTNLLFFRETGSKLVPIDPNFLYTYFDLAKKQFNPDLKPVNARQWRVYKSEWVANNFGVAAAADQLQNAERTIEQSYTNGSEQQQGKELSEYFLQLDSRIKHHDAEKISQTPSGQCSTPLQGESVLIASAPIKPDCKNMIGCLFCKNYAVDPSAEGIKKLASMRYFINEIEQATHSDVHFETLYQSTKMAISQLIKSIGAISPEKKALVSKVESEVNDGQLTEYWNAKLSLFIDLGFIQ
ncbi:hypothetical protein SAMN05216237_4311 [Pseudomonas yamanorum]|nr:hypothetical protein SAMN05216237_4311 [Pseudomonas yamanorum]